MRRNTIILSICVALGFMIAIATRLSFFIFSPGFQYYRMGPIYHPTRYINIEDKNSGWRNLDGKPVIGMSGFPFQHYSDCVMGFHGTNLSPMCNLQFIGPLSIIFNTAFWAGVFYGIFWLFKKLKAAHV